MLEQSDGKIGYKEFLAIMLLTIAAKLVHTSPTLFLQDAQTAAWMLPLMSLLVVAAPFWLLLSVLRKTGKNLNETIYYLAGKPVGFILNFSLFVITLGGATLNSRSYVDAMQILYFPRTPQVISYAVFVGIAIYIALRGWESLGRTSTLVVPIAGLGLLTLLVLSAREARPAFLFPLLGRGIPALATKSVVFAATYADLLVLTAMAHKLRSHGALKKGAVVGLIVSAVLLSLLLAVYIMIYDYTGATGVLYPFLQLSRSISLARFLTQVEGVFVGLWALVAVVRTSIYLYMTAVIFGATFRIREYEPLVIPLGALSLLLGLLPANPVVNTMLLRYGVLYNATWPAIILLPPVLWVLHRWRCKQIA